MNKVLTTFIGVKMKIKQKNKLTKRKVSAYVKFTLICIILISMMMISGGCDSSPTKQKNGDNGVIDEPGVITMVTTTRNVRLQLIPLDDITVEWGDGNETMIFANQFENTINHSYENEGPHTITIVGDLLSLTSSNNGMTEINTEKSNVMLHRIDVSSNQLESVDLSKNTSLRSLTISGNLLNNINLQYNHDLRYLELRDVGLYEIDISNNPLLYHLDLSDNNLQFIDVSYLIELENLYLNNNYISEIDISKNIDLILLYLSNNQLKSLCAIENVRLSRVDITDNNFYEQELNNLFGTLQDGRSWTQFMKRIFIGNNPGTESCDRSIATNRRWSVSPQQLTNE